jgi:hypothetical protein
MGKRIKFRMHAKRNFRGAKAAKIVRLLQIAEFQTLFRTNLFLFTEPAQDHFARKKFIPTVKI